MINEIYHKGKIGIDININLSESSNEFKVKWKGHLDYTILQMVFQGTGQPDKYLISIENEIDLKSSKPEIGNSDDLMFAIKHLFLLFDVRNLMLSRCASELIYNLSNDTITTNEQKEVATILCFRGSQNEN